MWPDMQGCKLGGVRSIQVYNRWTLLGMDEKQDNDLIMPLNHSNRFVELIFKNKSVNKLAYKPTIFCLALAFLLFFSTALYMFAAMARASLLTIQYFSPESPNCSPGTNCSVSFTLTSPLQPPIYLLYQLQNFYQNQRLFIQSKSNKQLAGNPISPTDARLCSPYITNAQLRVISSWAGVPLDPSAVASPCGAFAFAFFNDTYSLSTNGSVIPIDESGLTWPGDQGSKYKRAPNSSATQWIDPQNEHFIVWMRPSGLPNFKKLWGKIHQPLDPGEYTLNVANNYRLPNWSDNKYVVLSTVGPAGGLNYLLPVEMLIVSLVCLAAAAYLLTRAIAYHKLHPRD